MKIGILTHGFMNWMGGIDFLSSTIDSISKTNKNHEFYIFIPSKGWRVSFYNMFVRLFNIISSLAGGRLPRPIAINGAAVVEMIKGLQCNCRIYEIDFGYAKIEELCWSNGIEIVLPSIKPLPANFTIPWLGYIADFQHKYLPKNFTSYELKRRDLWFAKMLMVAPAVIVNSNQTRNDAIKFHGADAGKLVKLPFNASPREEWLEMPQLVEYAGLLEDRYFLVCNQFWKHKGYEVAFKAFSTFIKANDKIHIVCTGATSDYRDAEYFSQLIKLIEDLQISSRVKILGVIPKLHQIYLMKNSLALLQPTFFEGGPGGGAVFDAISLGVPCIVSNIEVNLEINVPGVRFFEAGNSADLAIAMKDALTPDIHSLMSIDELRTIGERRRLCCGEVLHEALSLTILKFNNLSYQIKTLDTKEHTN
jgi:glycosyltransferase involved in cell wall biosynthesis